MELTIRTNKNQEVIDITDLVQTQVGSNVKAVSVYVAHTTCSVTTADLDPGAGEDLVKAVWQMIPKLDFARHHNPSHMPAHIAASVIGPSVTIPAQGGKLILGDWQRLVLIELDGPRERKLIVTNL